MTKIIFLLPPSEGKNKNPQPSPLLKERGYKEERLNFHFEKPKYIAENVTEKDLKCSGKRFEEGLELNKKLTSHQSSPEGKGAFMEAIKRYSGVMYKAIDYGNMNDIGKSFFEKNFLIFSGMYGILSPLDIIGNYKLPLEKADLYKFWWDKIPEKIIELKPDYIVNLLPINYAKLIGLGTNCSRHKKKLQKILDTGIKIININFLKEDYKKISHGVKKIKGEWIKNICENNILDYKKFGGEIVDNKNGIIDINIVKK